ncbi:MAG: hypothetical protein ACO3GP_02400 [Candidatus Limnocylindrus sp.]
MTTATAPSPLELRRRRAVQRFLDEGFPPAKAVRLAAMYLASLRAEDARRAQAQQQQAVTQEQLASSPIWTPPSGLPPHERLAARIAEFGRMTSEQAFQLAAKTARKVDRQRGEG